MKKVIPGTLFVVMSKPNRHYYKQCTRYNFLHMYIYIHTYIYTCICIYEELFSKTQAIIA